MRRDELAKHSNGWSGTLAVALLAVLIGACGVSVPEAPGPVRATSRAPTSPAPAAPAPSSAPDMGTAPAMPDGGVAKSTMTGCNGYNNCLNSATTAAVAKACDDNASTTAIQLMAAVYQCSDDFCSGLRGGTRRCTFDSQGNPENLDGSAAYDANGDATGDCAVCLGNTTAAFYNVPCQPTTDPACNAAACAPSVNSCVASTP